MGVDKIQDTRFKPLTCGITSHHDCMLSHLCSGGKGFALGESQKCSAEVQGCGSHSVFLPFFFCRWSVVQSPLRPGWVSVQNISQQFLCCLCTVTQKRVCAQEHICVLWKGRSYLMTAQLVQPQQFCWSFNSPGFPTASNSLFTVSISETRALIKPRDFRNSMKCCFHLKFRVLLDPAVNVGDVHLQWVLPKFHFLLRGPAPASLGIGSACANLFLGKEMSHGDLAEESKLFNLKW